jgi:hypothetical protein
MQQSVGPRHRWRSQVQTLRQRHRVCLHLLALHPGVMPSPLAEPVLISCQAPAIKRSTEASPKTLRAYELYAMSLTTSSKVQRVQFLKASLEIDPDFSNAIEDLAALEKRMQRYEDAAALEHERQSDEARRMFEQTDVPLQERSQRAFALLSGHMAAFRYNTLLEDARYLRTLDLPAVGTTSVREFASYAEFQARCGVDKDTRLGLSTLYDLTAQQSVPRGHC